MGRLNISPLIGNGMVLQQGVFVPVRGEAAPGTAISVSFLDKGYTTQADDNGTWQVTLDSAEAGGPYAMEITAVENNLCDKLIIEDIYIGDVWICSGQSNMEMAMQRVKDNFPEAWDKPVNSLIRQFKVPQEWEFSGPREMPRGGAWVTAAAETLHEFSAVAWFFAQAVFEKHNTPIGLINAAWGGTPAEAWMSREALAAFPEKIARGDHYADTALREEIARASERAIKAWDDALTAGDTGLQESWHKSGDAQWSRITLPGGFTGTGIEKLYGSLWLRKEFDAQEIFATRESKLWLGTIVDADTVYINGVEAGTTAYRYPPRKYSIPAGMLRKGKNNIVIRVICRNGDGGITKGKDFRFFSDYGSIELGGTWEYRVGMRAANPTPPSFFFQRQPMGLFNAMIAPILFFPCTGVLWYQGESNDSGPREYPALLPALINDWREKKQQPEMPFLIVQLPIFGEPEENNEASSWAVIREAQCSALSLPATGMAAALDLGEWNDLHPMNKKDVGRRLALAAEQVVYGNKNSAPGPLFRNVERRHNRLLLTFANRGAGLAARETPYVSVIAGGKSFRLPAEITGPDTLAIDVAALANLEKLLYAWANNPRDRQLYNTDGLPAIPFRISFTDPFPKPRTSG